MDRAEMFCQLLATKLVFYDLGDFQIFQLFKFVLKFEFASKPEHFELDSWREKPFLYCEWKITKKIWKGKFAMPSHIHT